MTNSQRSFKLRAPGVESLHGHSKNLKPELKRYLRDAARTPELAGCRRGLDRRFASFAVRLAVVVGVLAGLTDVDAALEERAVFNRNALGDDVAGQRAFGADIHAIAGLQVTAHFAEHHDFARGDVGVHDAVASDGDAVAGQIDGTFDATIDVKRFGARNLALDDQ